MVRRAAMNKSNFPTKKKDVKKFEELLGVKTDTWKFLRGKKGYFSYEPTSYNVLGHIFDQYPFQETDQLIDFGCGLGRVLFYAAYRNCNNVIGVEVNEDMYEMLSQNIQHCNCPAKMDGVFCPAEEYVIPDTANKFFLFNPFSVEYFQRVYCNILESIEKKPRENYIFLYNCTNKYTKFLKSRPEVEWLDYWKRWQYGPANIVVLRIRPIS